MAVVDNADKDNDGKIDIQEFIDLMRTSMGPIKVVAPKVSPEMEDSVKKLFGYMDANGNGYVVLKEIELLDIEYKSDRFI